MLAIDIRTIPHKKQRYPTSGDWFERRGVQKIRVSAMEDWRYEFLVALHEVVEAALCRRRCIKEEQVDAFDIAYEQSRGAGDFSEPGDDVAAPYHREHVAATMVERFIAGELGVDFARYEEVVRSL